MLKQAIDYVERHIESNMTMDEIAKAAMSSKYHFQRMFHALTGFTVSAYIRNRRLTLAAEALAGGDAKVIDIALKYGYESPEAFAKAFQRMHGVTPTAAKKGNVKLKAFPRLSFQIQIKGDTEMNLRMVESVPAQVVGKDVLIEHDPYSEIPTFVERIWRDGTIAAINKALGRESDALLNGYHYDFREEGSRRYLMGAQIKEESKAFPGLTTLQLPAQTYAVFESREKALEDDELGLEITKVWHRIYAEWFPSASFEQVEGPCMEKYYWTDETKTESICEVWIPVRQKAD
ncbi:AraC family transcriptional regulator [Paenibacillus daejeonensis]|uniref:AraC family transcriptional regulator n=1 Tax=Paenibacillus daejeonensis TaxID=135193 RepID=UPI0003682B23|nr:helix-turn-helix domain-containing protein [Paenibacillus daejeonensis]